MAVVDAAPYSFYDVIHKSQQSTWSAPVSLHETATPKRRQPGRCTSTPVALAPDRAGTPTPKTVFADAFDSLSPPQLDVPVPPCRLLGEYDDWCIFEAPPTAAPNGLDSKASSSQRKPFHKWIRSLHRRTGPRHSVLEKEAPHSPILLPEPLEAGHNGAFLSAPPLSASGSSLRFVSAVRSASVSLASVSAATRSRKLMARSRHLSRTDRSSRVSLAAPRLSEDSVAIDQLAVIDAATTERSLQRRRILEELITTEEAYIRDVRFLINVYVTILASLPALSAHLRTSIKRNLTDVIELHEDILGELHRVVPHSEYTHFDSEADTQAPVLPTTEPQNIIHRHRRWRSMDAVREHFHGVPLTLQDLPIVAADPQVGAEVSRIFSKRMNKFFIYEEYGAKYEVMMKDVASANKTMPEWESCQRGLETLASTLGSIKCSGDASKKSLTVGDLLVKPIQRVCKYPLLFAELLKFTPVCDCPNSHMEIDSALTRLRETTAEINNATNDLDTRAKLEKTWVLQDRLIIPGQILDAATRAQIRSFGRIQMCGVLHICWQTRDTVEGYYMICLLYDNVLCLAIAGKIDPIYTVQASIHRGGIKIEEVDNGRGLQCHTAPFSWKLLFERDHQLYEIMMTACSPKEEAEWRARLTLPVKGLEDWRESSAFSSLELDVKSLGNVFSKPGTMARRLSIHRATTVASKAPLCQVVLKNTSVVRDGAGTSTSGLAINRSQSLLTTNTRLPVLTPSRADRARLEGLISDIWSRELLPFPSMASRTRSEHLVRASSVMRKLSVTSLTGSFGKRSGSSLQLVRQSDTLERSEGPKPKDSLDFDGCVTMREFADDGDSVRKLKKPRMKVTRHRSLADDIAKLLVADGPKTTVNSPQFTMVKGTSRGSSDSTATGASILGACSANDLRVTACEKSLSPLVISASKENVYSDSATEKGRNASRWAKVGIARNDGKNHGFRSLFR